jgi:hypothetical protein
MATTTNYGWDTPDDTDLVKDGAAAIRTLGSSIDTTTKNLNPQTTTGALAYRSATANVNTALPIGTTGQVLTVAAGVPSWAAPASGGKVLQVVSASTATSVTITSPTYTDSGLSLSITPSSTTSKVLVLVMQVLKANKTGGSAHINGLKLLRAATTILDNDRFYVVQQTDNTVSSISYLDSPATTSATTYKTQYGFLGGIGDLQCQPDSTNTSTMILLEIGA